MKDTKWYLFDDSSVTQCPNIESIQNEINTGYIYLYEKNN